MVGIYSWYSAHNMPCVSQTMATEVAEHEPSHLCAGVTFHEVKAASVAHAGGSSTLTCSDGSQLHSSLVLDCTGHARKLVTFDQKFDPGYQAAYGMMIEVDSHPFELDTMLFMDWRDDHTKVVSHDTFQQLTIFMPCNILQHMLL